MDAAEARDLVQKFKEWVTDNFSEREREIILNNVVGQTVGFDWEDDESNDGISPKVILKYLEETKGEEFLVKYGNNKFPYGNKEVPIEYQPLSTDVKAL